MKKYVGLLCDLLAFIVAGCCFIAMTGSAVNVTILTINTSAGNAYDLIENGGVLYIVALVLLIVSLVLIAFVLFLDALKTKLSCKKYICFLTALVLIATGIFFLLAVPCLNTLTTINGVSISSLGNPSLGVGAIFSGILAFVAALVILVRPFVSKK